MNTIFQKIFGGFLLAILSLSVMIVFFSYHTIRSYYIDHISEELEHLNITLQLQLLPYMENNEQKKLDSLAKQIGEKIDTRITIIDTNGVVFADSKKNPKLMENHGKRPEIMTAYGGTTGKRIRYSTTIGAKMLYVAIPLRDKNRNIIGVIRLSLLIKVIDELISDLVYQIVNLAAIIIVLALLGVWFFSKSITKPLKDLVMASTRVAEGHFDTKVLVKSNDEIGALAESFNNMTSKIKSLFDQTYKQKEEWNHLIASLQVGFLVINQQGNILFGNDAYKKLFGKNNIEGLNLLELMPEKKIIKLYHKILKKKDSFTKEFEIDSKTLLCSATYVESKKEVIFLFHDLTEIKNLERIKRDIVTNVSHELRTPLTAIKGFVETLLDEDLDDDIRYYVSIVKRHTDRLVSIVKDLLLLSELEEATTKLEISEYDPRNVCENVSKIYEPKLEERDLHLLFTVDKNLATVVGDMFKIEQVLINLVDNAIKYSEAGEIKVDMQKVQNKIRISIKDTGIGIPFEDQKRIFERFYTVDKSRSRKMGGTGLGLSIVKHIVRAHNGTIEIVSEPQKGTEFLIYLPLDIMKSD